MKQHITKKQWDELNSIEKFSWNKIIKEMVHKDYLVREMTISRTDYPSIGQMIEFLGDDDYPKAICEEWGDGLDVPKDYIGISINELCDELWEAVKNKLNKC